jgi:ribosomal protein S6
LKIKQENNDVRFSMLRSIFTFEFPRYVIWLSSSFAKGGTHCAEFAKTQQERTESAERTSNIRCGYHGALTEIVRWGVRTLAIIMFKEDPTKLYHIESATKSDKSLLKVLTRKVVFFTEFLWFYILKNNHRSKKRLYYAWLLLTLPLPKGFDTHIVSSKLIQSTGS